MTHRPVTFRVWHAGDLETGVGGAQAMVTLSLDALNRNSNLRVSICPILSYHLHFIPKIFDVRREIPQVPEKLSQFGLYLRRVHAFKARRTSPNVGPLLRSRIKRRRVSRPRHRGYAQRLPAG